MSQYMRRINIDATDLALKLSQDFDSYAYYNLKTRTELCKAAEAVIFTFLLEIGIGPTADHLCINSSHRLI